MLLPSTRSSFAAARFFCSSSLSKKNKGPRPLKRYLIEELVHLKDSSKVLDVLAKSKEEGHTVVHDDIALAVHRLKSNKRYHRALMIWDFVVEKKTIELKPPDYASHISLIGSIRGLNSAEIYFEGIPEEMKGEVTYFSLFHLYVNKSSIAKAEALMEKLAEGGFLTTAQPYIKMMCLYMKNKINDKAEKMFKEVKKCIEPETQIYNAWLHACASANNVEAAEMVFSEMKEAKVAPNWLTHGVLAPLYIKNKLFEKAASALKEKEDLLFAGDRKLDCSSLIRMHADIGNKDEILRLWGKMKLKSRISDEEYCTLISTLLKDDSYDKAEEIYSEWAALHKGSRVPMIHKLWKETGKNPPVLRKKGL